MSERYRLTLSGMYKDDDGDWVKYEERANGGYVCPCPDGCNGCEVPDFAIKEIERLTTDRDEWIRLWKKASISVIDLQDRVAELESLLKGDDL